MAKNEPKLSQYRADRAFNEVHQDQVLELPDDHPYLKTGYMVPVDEASAVQVADPEESGETPDGADESAGGAGPSARPRGRG